MKKFLVSLGFSAMLLLPVGWSAGAVHVLSDSEMQNAVGSYNQDGNCDSADGCTLPTPTGPFSCDPLGPPPGSGPNWGGLCGTSYDPSSASTCDSLSLWTSPLGCYTTTQACYWTYLWHCITNDDYNPSDPDSTSLICAKDSAGTPSDVKNSLCRSGMP
jgi:hypothetical protein